MIVLLSPAKKLLPITTPYLEETTHPLFEEKTTELLTILKNLSPSDLARLMHLSEALADLNYHRYQTFYRNQCPPSHAYPAVFLFQGDVYQTLKANQWDKKTLAFAQQHMVILSGLYGLLRPLDLIQPYRLEMSTKLASTSSQNLYDFWKETITNALNRQLAQEANPLLVNLASVEYFTAIDTHRLHAPLLTIHFKEQIGNQLKVIGIHAKKARGAMACYINQHQLLDAESIKQFSGLNYRYCEQSSDAQHFNFIRTTAS